MNLDRKDYQILELLDLDCRATASKIGKSVRLHKETVRYRINKMVENRVIRSFFPVLDLAKTQHTLYKFYLKLRNADQIVFDNITSYAKNTAAVSWAARLDGPYHYGMAFRARNVVEYDAHIDAFYRTFRKYVHHRAHSVNLRGTFYPRSYLLGHKRKGTGRQYSASAPLADLDEIDHRMLSLLAQNARITGAEMGRALKLSTEACINRRKRLERSGIIKGYGIILSPEKANMIRYKVLLYLSDHDPVKKKRFMEYCLNQPNIVYVIKSLGLWDYELDMEVRSIDEHYAIMMQLLNAHADIIRDYNTLTVRQILKYVPYAYPVR